MGEIEWSVTVELTGLTRVCGVMALPDGRNIGAQQFVHGFYMEAWAPYFYTRVEYPEYPQLVEDAKRELASEIAKLAEQVKS